MNKQNEPSLEIQLKELIAEIRDDVPQIETWPAVSISMALLKAMRDPNSSVAKFQSRILAEESFGDLRNGWVGSIANGMVIQDHMLTLALIHACLRGKDPDLVISESRSFATRKTAELLIYHAVAGPKINDPIVLTPELRLLPWSQVPESSTARRLAPLSDGTPSNYFPSDEIVPTRAQPTCAIEVDTHILIRLERNYAHRTNDELLDYIEKLQQHTTAAEDVVRCIFLVEQTPIAIIAQWPFANDPAAERHFGGSMSHGPALFEFPLGLLGGQTIDADVLSKLWTDFTKLAPNDREVLRHAVDRLNLAKRRQNVLDRAIDLGIALEMLLLHGLDDKTELKFRLSLRGAHFIGGTKEQREANFNLLKKIYNLRSKAVHDGLFDKKHLEVASDVIEKGVAVASLVSRKIIQDGSFPKNWESEYLMDLGSEVADPPTSAD